MELVLNYSTTVKTLFENGDWEVKKDILNSLLWNVTIENKEIASVQYKMPFAALQNLNKTTEIAHVAGRLEQNRNVSSGGFLFLSIFPNLDPEVLMNAASTVNYFFQQVNLTNHIT
ncbi:MAG: hypothetical protein WCP97_08975 [bacterium]